MWPLRITAGMSSTSRLLMTAWTEELTLAYQFKLFDVYSVVANHTLVYVLT